MKIRCVNINSASTSEAFIPVLEDNLGRAKRPDTDISIVSCEPGLQKALDRFAIVTLNEAKMVHEIARNLLLCGLHTRAIAEPVLPIDLKSQDWLRNGMNDRTRVVDAIDAKAQQCVADGADVVIIGCAGLAPIATLEGYDKVPNCDVPVIDCLQAGLKMAEFRAELLQRPGWSAASGAGPYAKPRDRDISRVRRTFGRE